MPIEKRLVLPNKNVNKILCDKTSLYVQPSNEMNFCKVSRFSRHVGGYAIRSSQSHFQLLASITKFLSLGSSVQPTPKKKTSHTNHSETNTTKIVIPLVVIPGSIKTI